MERSRPRAQEVFSRSISVRCCGNTNKHETGSLTHRGWSFRMVRSTRERARGQVGGGIEGAAFYAPEYFFSTKRATDGEAVLSWICWNHNRITLVSVSRNGSTGSIAADRNGLSIQGSITSTAVNSMQSTKKGYCCCTAKYCCRAPQERLTRRTPAASTT